jgi:hypothetical protein
MFSNLIATCGNLSKSEREILPTETGAFKYLFASTIPLAIIAS